MPNLLERFCFDPESLSSEQIADLLAPEWLRIQPKWFSASFQRKRARYNPQQHPAHTKRADFVDWLRVQEDEKVMFHVTSLSSWDLQQVYWELPEALRHPFDALVHLTALPGFNAGYVFDPEDAFWQSVDMVNTYEVFKKPHDHLPKMRNPETGEVKIDISNNPGRSGLFPGMWLQAAWRMFFGPGAFRHISRERLLAFPDADRLEQLPAGVIFIELFGDPFSAALPENRVRQKAFREWIGLDELEAKGPTMPRNRNDPAFEIETGNFPHGGVRRITQWFDAERCPTPRSRAVRRITAELDERGQEIWSDDVEI